MMSVPIKEVYNNKAVFLDRDGVINRAIVINGKPNPPPNLEALKILPGVAKAMKKLQKLNWLLIVITNQPDVSRGKSTRYDIETINRHLQNKLPINEFRTCYHDDKDKCDCRKPRPGALLSAAQNYKIDLSSSFIVGDRWKDIEAGRRAGCKTIFINYGYKEKQPKYFNHSAASLLEAADIILGK